MLALETSALGLDWTHLYRPVSAASAACSGCCPRCKGLLSLLPWLSPPLLLLLLLLLAVLPDAARSASGLPFADTPILEGSAAPSGTYLLLAELLVVSVCEASGKLLCAWLTVHPKVRLGAFRRGGMQNASSAFTVSTSAAAQHVSAVLQLV